MQARALRFASRISEKNKENYQPTKN